MSVSTALVYLDSAFALQTACDHHQLWSFPMEDLLRHVGCSTPESDTRQNPKLCQAATMTDDQLVKC